ncbi:MAG: hypothetical protein ACT4QB_08590 [Gammaproteobacteria bacterium]
MLVVGERMQLVEVKAVEGDYPPRSRLAVGRDPFAVPVPTDVAPEPGTAWPDPQLAQVLKLAPARGSPWETDLGRRALPDYLERISQRLGDFEWEKSADGVPIIFPALVNDTNVPVRGCLLIRNHSVEFPYLQRRFIPRIIDANCEVRCFGCLPFHD